MPTSISGEPAKPHAPLAMTNSAHAGHERRSAPTGVAKPARRHEEKTERERVAGDDPLECVRLRV
jgi:hypothetical protein